MIRARRLPRFEPADFDIEWMPPQQIRGLRLTPQRLRNLPARSREFALGRRPGIFFHLVRVDFLHALIEIKTEKSAHRQQHFYLPRAMVTN
jgi:hypothetical protein